ncbi:tryptophan-rich sensory protein [Chitinophaga lutea]|uniref:Tryptophan-rich sensory protein n=1 Tax=Chitinophaga lutea TaxID=2488634 RepID=A0A3N4PHQ6_9BACT|nr:TspO/MBR family protein [Chitinophaga lutea]RPE08223.1 tryptophan-rich sensory protein [Chitinophaga lutea]
MAPRRTIPHYRQQSSFNLIALIVAIGVNVMANIGTLNGATTGEISAQYPNLFTPAGITFSIWSVIYLALLGFAGYQLWLAFSKGHEAELDAFQVRMKGWFLLNCLGNACWLFAWHYRAITLSLFFMLIILYSLAAIHRNFQIAHPGAGRKEKLFIHLPFGLYFGWISIATLANLTAWTVALGFNGIPPVAWTLAMMMIGLLVALFMILRYNNIYFGLVNVWAFYGIVLKREAEGGRESAPIIAAATVVIALLALALILQILRKRGQPG